MKYLFALVSIFLIIVGSGCITNITTKVDSPSLDEGFVEIGSNYLKVKWINSSFGKLVLKVTDNCYPPNVSSGGHYRELICDWFDVYSDIDTGMGYVTSTTPTGGIIEYTEYDITREDEKYYVSYKGLSQGKGYDSVHCFRLINGKLAFSAGVDEITGLRKYIMVYDNQEFGREYTNVMGCPKEIGGKLAYQARIGDNNYLYVIDGQEVGREYEATGHLFEINGKIGYMALKDHNWFIVYNGKEVGKEYSYIYEPPMKINDKLIFKVRHDGKEFYVMEE